MTIVRFESENYYFQFFKLTLKPQYCDSNSILEVVQELEKLIGFKIVRIYNQDSTGRPIYLYQAPKDTHLPPDKDSMWLISFIIEDGYFERLLSIDNFFQREKIFASTIAKFFVAGKGEEIKKVSWISSESGKNYKISKLRKNPKALGRPALYHQNAEDSPIELKFEEALVKNKIVFKKQQEVYEGGALLTVLDFIIEKPLIAIFCDGYKYHYDKLSVLKDRRQDRVLQLLGYKVLRFTGSEIIENTGQCIEEVKRFLISSSPT
ncbi:MAG: DUF559 domain-containing protein [Candidatus Riflebacteria bacterium]|nr:DUF559 domain-containing protein [Candidatus Riflebacteria bacterium]